MTGPVAAAAPGAVVAGQAVAGKPTLAGTVKQVAGMLWYNLLSEMNQNGLGGDALGTGGDSFQSLFLWNIAQNDFSKYDSALTAAATRQMAGGTAAAPSAPSASPAPAGLAYAPADATAPLVDVAASALPAADEQDVNTLSESGALAAQAVRFTKAIWPQIITAAQLLGVPPEAVLAQAALETGWGASVAGNNLFGVKAADGQSGTVRATREMQDGVLVPQTASFRDYGSVSESISDYVGLIDHVFSGVVGQTSIAGFATALQNKGYATDTHYAAKIIAIAQSPIMSQVMRVVAKTP